MTSGFEQCHSLGRPNADGTIGNCTACHTRHTSSVRISRLPSIPPSATWQPDHPQIKIYENPNTESCSRRESGCTIERATESFYQRTCLFPLGHCHRAASMARANPRSVKHCSSYYLAAAITDDDPLCGCSGQDENDMLASATRRP